MDITVKSRNIMPDYINGPTLISDFICQGHQILQTFLHILLIGTQATFLLLYLLSYLRLLILQAINSHSRFFRSSFLFGRTFLLRSTFLFGCRFLDSRLSLLLNSRKGRAYR